MRSSAHQDEPYSPLSGAVIRVGDFEPGLYAVQWWKPGWDKPAEVNKTRCGDGTILVSIPDGLRWHWLAKIVRASACRPSRAGMRDAGGRGATGRSPRGSHSRFFRRSQQSAGGPKGGE